MIKAYVENDVCLIYRTRDRFGKLSNMCAGMPVWHNGTEWNSSEALYQALRFPQRPDIHAAINAERNGFLSKQVAHRHKDETRADWQSVKVPIMEQVLRLKTAQYLVAISTELDLTGERDIVEKSLRDDFWGAIPDDMGKVHGENVLGILWMIIREMIRQDQFDETVELEI